MNNTIGILNRNEYGGDNAKINMSFITLFLLLEDHQNNNYKKNNHTTAYYMKVPL